MIACIQTLLPLVKIGEPFSDFYWGKGGGGGSVYRLVKWWKYEFRKSEPRNKEINAKKIVQV